MNRQENAKQLDPKCQGPFSYVLTGRKERMVGIMVCDTGLFLSASLFNEFGPHVPFRAVWQEPPLTLPYNERHRLQQLRPALTAAFDDHDAEGAGIAVCHIV